MKSGIFGRDEWISVDFGDLSMSVGKISAGAVGLSAGLGNISASFEILSVGLTDISAGFNNLSISVTITPLFTSGLRYSCCNNFSMFQKIHINKL